LYIKSLFESIPFEVFAPEMVVFLIGKPMSEKDLHPVLMSQ
jgi:hypothetical protein